MVVLNRPQAIRAANNLHTRQRSPKSLGLPSEKPQRADVPTLTCGWPFEVDTASPLHHVNEYGNTTSDFKFAAVSATA